MLKEFFYTVLARKRIVKRINFQQDKVPNYSTDVKALLDEKFPKRWIGRRGPIEWTARLPDLTPCDFFLCGYAKQKVYQQKITDIADLKQKITNEIRSISQDTCRRVFSEIQKRMILVKKQNGAYIEQLL